MTSSNGNIFRVTTGNLFLMRFKIQKHLFDNAQQSYKLTEQCENKSNISWWVHVWRPSLSTLFSTHHWALPTKYLCAYPEVNGYLLLCWCRLYVIVKPWSQDASSHRQLNRLFNSLFRVIRKKHESPALLAICKGNSPITGVFPSQRARNAESVSMSWRHNGLLFSGVDCAFMGGFCSTTGCRYSGNYSCPGTGTSCCLDSECLCLFIIFIHLFIHSFVYLIPVQLIAVCDIRRNYHHMYYLHICCNLCFVLQCVCNYWHFLVAFATEDTAFTKFSRQRTYPVTNDCSYACLL